MKTFRRKTMLSDRGTILAATALCLSLILAVLGCSIDIGHIEFVKRSLQSAADAAALAAALESRTCSPTYDCTAMQTAAQSALKENGLTATTTLTNCSGSAGSGVSLMINNPPCSISSDPNASKSNYAEAIVTEQVPTYFAWLAGVNSFTVKARAEAGHGIGGPCIYALDTQGAAINIFTSVLLNSKCAIVDESTASNSLSCAIGLGVYAPTILLAGGYQNFLCNTTPTPITSAPLPNPRDPLAYVSAPSNANSACGTSIASPYSGSSSPVNVTLLSTVVFNPGVYCGGISINAALGCNITFNPGTYILRDTSILGVTYGGLSIALSALSTISGQGVTFYNVGPTGAVSVVEPLSGGSLIALSNLSLSAPTSGTYAGILFFQQHGVTSSASFVASLLGAGTISGAFYFPDGTVTYGVSGSPSYDILVAKDINISLNSSFGNTYSSLQVGSPLNGNDVSLVE